MAESSRNVHSSSNIPDITPLSIAFPMTFESVNPEPSDPRRANAKPTGSNGASHRHDAGK